MRSCAVFLLTSAFLAIAWFSGPAAAQAADPAEETATAEVPPAEALLRILRDDAARGALIAELERIATGEPRPEAAPAPILDIPAESIGRRIAQVTQEAAQGAVDRVQALWATLVGAPALFQDVGTREFDVLIEALWDLLLVIVVTIAIFLLLRRSAIPIYRRMGAHARDRTIVQKTLIYLGSGLIDALVVIAAWAIGYAIALSAFGEFGQIGIRQTLYLNAFLAVEMVKVGFRMLLSPSTGDLRPMPIGDVAARRLSRHVNVLVSLLGYGQLLVVPVINANASYLAGRSLTALISVVAVLYAAILVIRHRRAVADWLVAQTRTETPPVADQPEAREIHPDALDEDPLPLGAAEGTTPRRSRRRGLLEPVARTWHWVVLIYLAALLLIVLSRPGPVVFDVLWVSAQIALALLVGVIASGLLGKVIASGVRLPPGVTARLPLLESRLNRFVPQALLVLRLVIVAALALFILGALGALSPGAWLDSPAGLSLVGTTVSVLLILLAAFLIWLALVSWVDYRLNPDFGQVPTAREQTLLTLLRNAALITLVVLTLMFTLSEIGLNIGPLLASAGVLGLAIGFGAQKMVQDIITGIFIQFERAINVGDVVSAGGVTGAVERLTIRSVSLRDLQGIYHIIPFSSVDTVSNYTREFSYYVIDMGVAYRENVEETKQAMFDAYAELRRHEVQGPFVIGEELEWFGLDAFGDSAVMLKCRIKTLPGKQWGVGRAYNEIVKRVFDERNIEIPFPHRTIYLGERKDGSTQTINVSDDAGAAGEQEQG